MKDLKIYMLNLALYYFPLSSLIFYSKYLRMHHHHFINPSSLEILTPLSCSVESDCENGLGLEKRRV